MPWYRLAHARTSCSLRKAWTKEKVLVQREDEVGEVGGVGEVVVVLSAGGRCNG